jgi:hypothetical protein
MLGTHTSIPACYPIYYSLLNTLVITMLAICLPLGSLMVKASLVEDDLTYVTAITITRISFVHRKIIGRV